MEEFMSGPMRLVYSKLKFNDNALCVPKTIARWLRFKDSRTFARKGHVGPSRIDFPAIAIAKVMG
jgi:hypothetical protein